MVSAETFHQIQSLISDYVWALDMADIDTLMGLFTEDMVFQDTAGNVYPGAAATRGYFEKLVATPAFRGRQHHIDNLRITDEGGTYLIRSYWTVTKWDAAAGTKVFEVVGHGLDRMRQTETGLKFCERRVMYWRSDNCPWVPDGTAV